MSNFVFLATSLDGFIARADGSIDWLENMDNPANTDYGYNEFLEKIDAIVIGRNTYAKALTFKAWPYSKPVFVLSTTLKADTQLAHGVRILSKNPPEIVAELKRTGFENLYIDGGKTIQSFMAHGLIDELIITRVPILLGSGIPLFSHMAKQMQFAHKETIVYSNGLVKSHYRKIQNEN